MLNVDRETFRSISHDMRVGCFYSLYQEYGYFYIEKLWELRTRDMSKIGRRAAAGSDYMYRRVKAQYNCGMRQPPNVSIKGQSSGGGDLSRYKTYGDYLD